MLGAEMNFARFARRILPCAVLAPMLALTGWAFPGQNQRPGLPRAEKHEGRHEIDRLEDKWRNAILKNDAAALEPLLAEEYVGIRPNGTLETRDQFLARVRGISTHLAGYEVIERKVRFYGRTALVTSLVAITDTSKDDNLSGSYRYTRVYARDPEGAWKIVNFEATRLNSPDEVVPGPGAKK
jgi:ketosteroid isomerase-like protein